MTWIVVMTRPNQEAKAAYNLSRQGYTHYCPKIMVPRLQKGSVVRPLFPRYMFVLIDQLWYSLKGTFGVSKVLLGLDGAPAPIAEQVITNLKAREKHGLIQLTPAPKFRLGQKLKTTEGALAGHLLLYEGMSPHERCRVLVTLLGQQVRVSIEERLLAAA